MAPKKQGAPFGGAQVNQADGPKVTNQTAQSKSNIEPGILARTETTIEVQLAKLLALLLIGPKNTIELRGQGIMMPAARVFQLKNEQGYVITTERVALYDAEGIRHRMCARYHLNAEASRQQQIQISLDLEAVC